MSPHKGTAQYHLSTIKELNALIADLERACEREGRNKEEECKNIYAQRDIVLQDFINSLTAHDLMTHITRNLDRPQSLDYFRILFDNSFRELRGDRIMGDDQAIIGGTALFEGQPVIVLGHQKGRTAKERGQHNSGSAGPAGYRKVCRLIQLANQLGVPVFTFIDTAGADCSVKAEAFNISQAIADSQEIMGAATIPIICTIIGEGGSGGAIGIGVGNRILMLLNAIYSVIDPAGCAAILFNNEPQGPERTAKAAEALKITASHSLAMGIVDEIIPEPPGGAHLAPRVAFLALKEALSRHLQELQKLTPEQLREDRYQRFARIGGHGYI